MNTMFLEFGAFTIALIVTMFFQVYGDIRKYRDCLLFSRLLLAAAGIMFIDTVGWVIDGNPIASQVWITTVVDGLDLILTTTVCWCWVNYALYIAYEHEENQNKILKHLPNFLLILQIVLVLTSQIGHFYFSVDASGVYHREKWYILHTLNSLTMLLYSSASCIYFYVKEKSKERKKELLFIATIILIPVVGNIFQLFVYGYPTVWICMVFMIFTVYIHIHNKRTNEERQEQNKVLKAALVQARAANDAKTEFFARMSHDMRTPMNGILGLANLSLDEPDIKILHQNIVKMKTVGEYMLGLINDTLDFQKIESGKMVLEPQVISSCELLESICSMVRETASKKDINFKINTKNVDLEQYIKVDPLRIKQIFINLLSNAIKFTPPGGTVELGIEQISITGNVSHDIISISDTGIGMSKQFLNEGIFIPFTQEYNSITQTTSGTGLGLSISKKLVELMDGTIQVESEQGSGTTFMVALDFEHVASTIVQNHSKAYTEQIEHIEQVLKGKRILLAEDHPLNAEIATRLLQKKQCEVIWTKNGRECVEQLEASAPNTFDLILMDIRMPIMDGLEAAATIRSLNRPDAKQIPIIAMTANAYEEDMKHSQDAGMNAHLAKPIAPEVMYQTIVTYLNK